jgi:hypothetical protein
LISSSCKFWLHWKGDDFHSNSLLRAVYIKLISSRGRRDAYFNKGRDSLKPFKSICCLWTCARLPEEEKLFYFKPAT